MADQSGAGEGSFGCVAADGKRAVQDTGEVGNGTVFYKGGFQMFLVILRHTMDDLPIALFETEAAAIEFAQSVDEMPTPRIREIYNCDCSTPICVGIVEFANGYPEKFTVAREFLE